MQYDEKWNEAIASLAGNHSFRLFLDGVKALREDAISEAEMLENVADERRTCSLLGRSKAFREIVDLFGDYAKEDNVD